MTSFLTIIFMLITAFWIRRDANKYKISITGLIFIRICFTVYACCITASTVLNTSVTLKAILAGSWKIFASHWEELAIE